MAPNSTHPRPCYPVRDAVSNGVLQHDNPIDFALPLLVIQITVVLLVTRTMAFLFKPFRQPRVLAEVIGGVLLGPSGFGRSTAYMKAIFPKSSLTLIDTVATLGLLFFLFMVGLELDLGEIRRSGRTALVVAVSGIALPFVGGLGVANLVRESLSLGTRLGPLVVFMGVPLSITAFPVLVRIMAERRLLGTSLGKVVVPAAAINDVCAWILLAVGVALSGPATGPATPAYVLLAGLAFVIFMLVVTRRFMEWVARRASAHEEVGEIYVCVAMVGVLLSGFATDAIGIHPLFGAFVFGLVVPKDGPFARSLTSKIEDFVTVLMLPLFFASSGLKTNLSSLSGLRSLGFLVLLVLIAGLGKISATVAVALSIRMPVNEALAFGFLMSTKGLVELIVLNIGKDLGVFNDEAFAILVLMCLILMFFTTPAVMALYKPARTPVPYTNRKLEGSSLGKKDQLRVLVCVHGTGRSIPALVNFVEACRGNGSKRSSLKLFVMHLIELSDRASSIMALSRAAQREKPDGGGSEGGAEEDGHHVEDDNLLVAFKTYGQISKVPVRCLTAVSDLSTMHYDVCNAGAERRATVILLPYNSLYHREDGSIDHVNSGLRAFYQKVMHHAPCSVAMLVDRGSWGSETLSESSVSQKVAVFFLGGPDDREALTFGRRLVHHPNVSLQVFRFLLPNRDHAQNHVRVSIADSDDDDDVKLDEESLAAAKTLSGVAGMAINGPQLVSYEEKQVHGNMTEAVLATARAHDFSLILVGKSRKTSALDRQSESSELGALGEALVNASSSEMKSSILVIQQHVTPTISYTNSKTPS